LRCSGNGLSDLGPAYGNNPGETARGVGNDAKNFVVLLLCDSLSSCAHFLLLKQVARWWNDTPPATDTAAEDSLGHVMVCGS
jgi:hypothetical protein